MSSSDARRVRWRTLVTEPARPGPIREHPRQQWIAVAVVCTGAFMGQLDASIVSIALPTLRNSFHVGIGSVQWVSLAYLLPLCALVVAVGKLSDTVGRKLLYCYGFAFFALASALCALAPGLTTLVVFRVFQGTSAALMQANSVAIIASIMKERELPHAIGYQGAAQALGLGLGPALGGVLISAWGWRSLFWINVPVGIAACVAGILAVPRTRERAPRTRFDGVGLVLLASSLVTLLLGLARASSAPWTSPATVALLAAGVVAAFSFFIAERRVSQPLLPPELFSDRAFTSGIAGAFFSYASLFGVLFSAPFVFEDTFGSSNIETGLRVAILPVAIGIAAPCAGKLARDALRTRMLTIAGMLIAAAGLFAVAASDTTSGILTLGLGIAGIGTGLFLPPNNAAIMATASPTSPGLTGGALNATRSLGASAGLAGAASLLGSPSALRIASRAPELHGPAAPGVARTFVLLGALAVAAAASSACGYRRPYPGVPSPSTPDDTRRTT